MTLLTGREQGSILTELQHLRSRCCSPSSWPQPGPSPSPGRSQATPVVSEILLPYSFAIRSTHGNAGKEHGHDRRSDHEQDHRALEHAENLHARSVRVVLLLMRRGHLKRVREAAARRRQRLAVGVVSLDVDSSLRLGLLPTVLLLLAFLRRLSLLRLSGLSLGSLQGCLVRNRDNKLWLVDNTGRDNAPRSCRIPERWPGRRADLERPHCYVSFPASGKQPTLRSFRQRGTARASRSRPRGATQAVYGSSLVSAWSDLTRQPSQRPP